MDVTDFNNNFLHNLFKKINQEQKKVFLLGDLNVDLMHYNENKPTNEFLDSLASNFYLSYIIQPSRHTSHSRTFIDNIFSDVISKEIICGNITATISDYLLSFWSHRTLLLIHPSINLMFLKEAGQNLTRKILSWITLI